MAASDFERDIEELAQDHERASQAMEAVLLAYLAGTTTLEDAEAAIDTISQALAATSAEWVAEITPLIYADGVAEAQAALGAAGEPVALAEVHELALGLAEQDLSAELAATTNRMSDDAKGTLREIGRRQAANMMATGSNAIPEAARMVAELEREGVRFIDRGGRRWEPRAYSEMVLRTHSVKLSNMANLNAAGSMGSPGVLIRDGRGPDIDAPCVEADGQRWSLSWFAANLVQHPNCTRSGSPLPSTWKGKLDRE